MCKDSHVFALEGSVETILNQGGWKDSNQIYNCLKELKENQAIDAKKIELYGKEFDDSLEEVFVDEVMDRLCVLFPMKYQRQSFCFESSKFFYKRTNSFRR
jgi:hypothetical protein